jgi:hypothetical protein
LFWLLAGSSAIILPFIMYSAPAASEYQQHAGQSQRRADAFTRGWQSAGGLLGLAMKILGLSGQQDRIDISAIIALVGNRSVPP